jgi:hypothetical protein
MIPAPVEYDARDFILHVFSSVCLRTLKLEGVSISSPWESLNKMQRAYGRNLLASRAGVMVSGIVFGVGTLLLTRGFFADNNPLPAVIAKYFSSPLFLWGFVLSILGYGGSTFGFYQWRRARLEQVKSVGNRELRDKEIESAGSLAKEASLWLDKIRFQQSYSSGWTGTLKLPVAAEGAVNAAVTLAQNELSLPEIIEGYRDFLKFASQSYMIIIGIDELDKLESDEKAERFLNEIKALFGIPGCFYSISVSESAMSSFERRGLPFRDVFDSSFDAIIYVDYLNLEEAQHLLRRRVIGLPTPFLYFCFCMSGGLARDLIRPCRNLLELAQAHLAENDLSKLCSLLIKSDIKSKLRAVSIAARKIALKSEVNQFFDKIRQLEITMETSPALLKSCQGLFNNLSQQMTQKSVSEAVISKYEKWVELNTELTVYLYYSATLLEFFDKKLDPEKWKDLESSGELDKLVRARQFFAISPHAANSIISDFRNANGIDGL